MRIFELTDFGRGDYSPYNLYVSESDNFSILAQKNKFNSKELIRLKKNITKAILFGMENELQQQLN